MFLSVVIKNLKRELNTKVVKSVYKINDYCEPVNGVNNHESEIPQGSCRIGKKPLVTVTSPTSLHLSWKDSFKDCEEKNIVETKLFLDKVPSDPAPRSKEALLHADPCLRHKIEVTL